MRLGAFYICFFFVCLFFPYSGESGSQISNLHFPWKKKRKQKNKRTNKKKQTETYCNRVLCRFVFLIVQ